MPNEQNDKVNKLLGRQGSIAERTKIASELNDDQLQMAAPYSPQATEEIERRRHERLLSSVRAPMTSEDEIEKLVNQLELLSDRFVKSSEGLILQADDEGNFKQIILEATSLLDDVLGADNKFSKEASRGVIEGSGGFFGGPSYNCLRAVQGIFRASKRELERRRATTSRATVNKKRDSFVSAQRMEELKAVRRSKQDNNS